MDLIERVSQIPQVVDVHLDMGTPLSYESGGRLEVLDNIGQEVIELTLRSFVEGLSEQERALLEGRGSTTVVRTSHGGIQRIHLFRTGGRVAATIRFERESPPALSALGYPPNVTNLANAREGLLLVTGPRGSGKTTLTSALTHAIDAQRPIVAWIIEAPPEFSYSLKGVARRIHVGPRRDVPTFSEAVRSALRAGVHLIVIGELFPDMRDDDTVIAMLQAVEAGLLVLATLHASSVTAAFERIAASLAPSDVRKAQILLGRSFAGAVNLRLLPHAREKRYVPACEVVLGDDAVRAALRTGNVDAIDGIVGTSPGMQRLGSSIERLVAEGMVSRSIATPNLNGVSAA